MLDRLLDHKADEHFFEEVHAPIFYLCRELLMRNIEKVSQLLGVVEPEKVRKSSRHEHLERDEIAFAKLVMKEGEKPGKFLLPHGIILLEFGPYRIFMEGNPEGIQNQRPLGIMELSVNNLLDVLNIVAQRLELCEHRRMLLGQIFGQLDEIAGDLLPFRITREVVT